MSTQNDVVSRAAGAGRAAWAVLLSLVLVAAARAQNAPAGNAHPEEQSVSSVTATNPFGESAASTFDVRAKVEFAGKVNLEPLRGVPVFHDGRVKVLDTLARETVAGITGRARYVDLLPKESDAGGDLGKRPAKKIKHDPLFTLFDLIIDPRYYDDKPLVHVEYLPLREAMLRLEFPAKGGGAGQASGGYASSYGEGGVSESFAWWNRQGRLPPPVIQRQARLVVQGAGGSIDENMNRGLNQLVRGMGLYSNGWQNLLLGPAHGGPHATWDHLAVLMSGKQDPRIPEAVRAMATAWRAGDAEGVNKAAATLGEALEKLHTGDFVEMRRTVEIAYNKYKPFEYGMWIYLLSALMLLLAFGTGRRWLVIGGVAALLAAVLLHSAGFAARCYIAERLAIQNQFESMTGLSLCAAVVGMVVMAIRRQWLFGAAAAAGGFLVLVTATQTGIPGKIIEREAPILNTSVLLKYHVTTVLVSYGLITLGMVVSAFYLVTYYASRKTRMALATAGAGGSGGASSGGTGGAVEMSAAALGLDDEQPRGPQRVLSELDTAQMIILQLAFWTLGVGILLGAWWADHSWGRWWGWDPKETFALITWIVYLIVIHLRFTTTKNRALTTAWLSIVGFIVMVWTYFGVNLLLPGLHAYA